MIFHYLKIILIVFLIFIHSSVFSQKRKDLEKMRIEKLKEMENIEDLLSKTKKDKNFSFTQISLLNRKIIIRNEIIDNLNSEIQDIGFKVDLLSSDITYKNSVLKN